MKPLLKACCLGIALIIASTHLNAQQQNSKYALGFNLGTLVYQGDLVPGGIGNLKTLKPALGLNVTRMLDPYFSLRGNLVFGKISSDESKYAQPEYRQHRNFKFSTPVTELSALLIFNPFGESDGSSARLTPYVFAGAGLSFLNIKRDYSRFDTTYFPGKSAASLGLGIDTLQKMKRVHPILPVGAGLKYQVTDQLSINAEAMYRYTGYDYIDGFKQAANPKSKDSYYGISVGISYRLGGYRCPVSQ